MVAIRSGFKIHYLYVSKLLDAWIGYNTSPEPMVCIIHYNQEVPELSTKVKHSPRFRSSLHQYTPVVLNYNCCGVAAVVLGLNWPVCFPPLSQVRRKSVSPGREVPRSTNLLAGAESLKLWDTLSIYDCRHLNKTNKNSSSSMKILIGPIPT